MQTHRLPLVIVALTTIVAASALAQDLTLPNQKDSLKFAVIGDSGTGNADQYRTAKVFVDMRQKFLFEFVLMLGDNMYGGGTRATSRISSRGRTNPCSTPASSSTRPWATTTARNSACTSRST
ncbi:MAG: hypothetical protein EXQ48_08615 [Acidobacteria bacterium]|nr:hypothetical protein [Acidobacteriota bacterium]